MMVAIEKDFKQFWEIKNKEYNHVFNAKLAIWWQKKIKKMVLNRIVMNYPFRMGQNI